jgi:peroxiredoxin Q/BCP
VPLGQLRIAGTVHVGERAPDFTAVSSSGNERTLSRLKGDWLVLVFVQSREDFAKLRDLQSRLVDTGPLVFGICKDKPQRLRAYARSERLPFELLADDTGEISSLYGYYNWERRETTRGFVVMDRFGVVRLALQGQAPEDQVADLTRYTIAGY